MPITKCCICGLSKDEVTLFNFPKNVRLRELWVSRASAYCQNLVLMSTQQILQRKICIKHFEKKFLVNNKRQYKSCPSLFTDEEVSTGVSSNPECYIGTQDHTYSISNNDHTYSKKPLYVEKLETLATLNTPFEQSSNMEESTTYNRKSPISSVRGTTRSPRMRLINRFTELSPKCRKLYNSCKKILKRRRLFEIRKDNERNIKNAEEFAQTKEFQKLVDSLNYMQKNIILMQIRNSKLNKNARRYNFEEKLLCLSLYKQSPKGYSLLQQIFKLPAKRTINRILHNVKIESGINEYFCDMLKDRIIKWTPTKKICSIVFDEIQLSSHLHFSPAEDHIYGFVQKNLNIRFADHALVFMVRGICTSWRQPFAFYFCEGTMPAAQLKKILNDVVDAVVHIGLEPIAFICDQGMTFQSTLKSLQEITRRLQMQNNLQYDGTVSLQGCNISIIYDPPHLLKGIRNNMLTKDLLYEGRIAKWQDIIDIYNFDCKIGQIRMLPKLTDEHVIPDKIRKMKVSYCSTVLSERVAATLRYTAQFTQHQDGSVLSSTYKNTADAVEFFDKLFDSCNGSRTGNAAGKIRGAVKESSQHLAFWKGAINKIKNMYFLEKKRTGENVTKTVPSLNNWVTTLESLIRITNILFSKGVKFFYTRNLNQDPLENFFGKIRSHNYRFNNPDTYTFQNSYKSLLMTNIFNIHSKYANCEEDIGATIINLKHLITPQGRSTNSDITTQFLPIQQSIIDSENISQGPGNRLSKVQQEKININSKTYTSGFVTRKLFKNIKCNNCRKTIITKEILGAHSLTTFRERTTLKHRNLIYNNTQFIVAFSKLIDLTNEQLEKNCHKAGILKSIKKQFLKNHNMDWLGCPVHKTDLIHLFIRITSVLQIYNWCKGINLILKGSVQKKINPSQMDSIQKLALQKFVKTKRFNKTK